MTYIFLITFNQQCCDVPSAVGHLINPREQLLLIPAHMNKTFMQTSACHDSSDKLINNMQKCAR